MGRSSHLVQFFWVASPVLQLIVAAVMVRRRLHREYPFFFTYTLFRSTTALIMFWILKLHFDVNNVYGEVLLVHETGCIILRFAVIYEVFLVLLRPYSTLIRTAKLIFRWVTAALFLLAVAIAAEHHWPSPNFGINGVLDLVDRSVDVMQCGILVALLIVFRYLWISWRTFAFGVVVGLGIYASVALMTAAAMIAPPRISSNWGVAVTLVDMIAYTGSVLVWLVYCLLPEPVSESVKHIPAHNLDAWNDELERLLQQ